MTKKVGGIASSSVERMMLLGALELGDSGNITQLDQLNNEMTVQHRNIVMVRVHVVVTFSLMCVFLVLLLLLVVVVVVLVLVLIWWW